MRTEFSHPFLSFHQSITYRTATSFVPSKPWLQTGEYDHVSKPKKGHLNNWVRGVQSIQVSLSEPTTPGNRICQQTCLRETLTIFYTCYLMQDQESTDLILDHPSHQDKCRHYIVSGKVTALTSFLLNPTTIPSTSQIWKSGHKHVIWPWYEVRCRNVGLTSTNMNATVAWWSNPGLLVELVNIRSSTSGIYLKLASLLLLGEPWPSQRYRPHIRFYWNRGQFSLSAHDRWE